MMPRPLVWLPLTAILDPSNWTWRWSVGLILLGWAVLYLLGWYRLQRRGMQRAFPRLVAAAAGWCLLVLALLSPIDWLGGSFFSWHMIQHLFLLYAAPLILAAWPLPVLLWSLPKSLRRVSGRLFRQAEWAGWLLRRLTTPKVGFLAGTVTLWLWHYPPLYDAAVQLRWLHDVEHVTFFLGSLLYWWPLVGAPPVPSHLNSDAKRVGYLILGNLQSAILGVIITFWPTVLYHRFLAASLSAGQLLSDQAFGGLVMWLSGPFVVGLAGLLQLGQGTSRPVRVAESPQMAPH